MVASFIRGCTFIRAMSSWPIFHGLLTPDFGKFRWLWLLKLYRWSQVDILLEALPLWDQQGLLSFHGFMLRGVARGQYLGQHILFFLSLEDYLMDQYFITDVGSVWHKHWHQTMYVGQWPVFHESNLMKTIWWTNVIIWILVSCDANIYPITFMSVSELYFMVQWFWLVSWRLFDGWMFTVDTDWVWHKHWPETIYVGQWSIFHGPLTLPYTLRII